AEEARRIARLWEGSSVLRVGPAVTLRRLSADLSAAEVFHFAGHARELSGSFTGSGLPLAVEDPDDLGLWTAEQIARSPLPRTRLVVLAGCRTAEGSRSTIEGPASLARAFFAAGVPSVVGSLWNVDDVPTAEPVIRWPRADRGLAAQSALSLRALPPPARFSHGTRRRLRPVAGARDRPADLRRHRRRHLRPGAAAQAGGRGGGDQPANRRRGDRRPLA